MAMSLFFIQAWLLSFLSLVVCQEYAGTPITNSLPGVVNAEVTYMAIHNSHGDTTNYNHTLINYMSLNSSGKRPTDFSKVKRAVVIVHGLQRDPGTYMANTLSALEQARAQHPEVNRDSVMIMTPYFPNGDDKNFGYPWVDGQSPGYGSYTNALVWSGSGWSSGEDNVYPRASTHISSYDCLDQIIQWFDNSTVFPNLKSVVIGGHSLGGQTVQRYAAVGNQLNTKARLSYWVGNPNSYLWFNSSRPYDTSSCDDYDTWREGLFNYSSQTDYNTKLVAKGGAAVLSNYMTRNIAYGRGMNDMGDDSSGCAPETTGANRNERFFNFINYFPPSCTPGGVCQTVDEVAGVGHDAGSMMAAASGKNRLFFDNFNGTGNVAYDTGCPRIQTGDDPFPDPSCTAPIVHPDNGTYANGFVYQGCWTDSGASYLSHRAYAGNSAATVETCVQACINAGYSIAGAEYGDECYCDNTIAAASGKTTDLACTMPCAANSTEICGAGNRLSVFSAKPVQKAVKPSLPAAVGNYNLLGCYTDNTAGRALTAKSYTSGSAMTLESCASYCSGYTYFGTEYASECYCGNSIVGSNTLSTNSKCSMLCSGNTTEYCGAGNFLSLYVLNNTSPSSSSSSSVPSSTTSSTSSTSSIPSSTSSTSSPVSTSTSVTSSPSSSATTTTTSAVSNTERVESATSATSSASATTLSTSTKSSSTSATPSATALSCPGSNSTIYNSAGGANFVIECGTDRSGGDLSSKEVSTFRGCIDLCSQTSGCIDVAYLGVGCYMKSSVGAAIKNSVWGARQV